MRVHRTFVLAAFLLLYGCGGKLARPFEYTAAIDPAFAPDEVQAITAALDNWNASVPNLSVTYTIASCDSPGPQQVCFQPINAPPDTMDDVVGETEPTASEGATVLLYVARMQASRYDFSALLQQTAAHEMGHAMGLKHTATGTLMAAYVQDQTPAVTSADVTQFLSVSGEPEAENIQ